jgi:copper oxidase (laccase) domain-containing protein
LLIYKIENVITGQIYIGKTIQSLKVAPENISVMIGPHIQKPSFEVENDVRDLLLKSVGQAQDYHCKKISEAKSLIDLNALVKDQLSEISCLPENIFCEFIDTKTILNYHSARRDKENSGRQISWISLK